MTLRRAATFVAVVLLAGSGLHAQRRVLPPGAALLGQVVDAHSGRGLERAIVEIDGAGLRRKLVTDHRGRFLFTGLPDGEYQILASRSGYLNGAFGQRRAAGDSSTITLTYGQWINNVDISLWRPAVITGFVADEAGAPIAGVTVRAYRHDHRAGHTALREVSRAFTDDIGAYRLGSLVPGDHLVGISGVNNPDADIDVLAPGVEVFAPAYYPSAELVAGAVTVTAESGRDVAGIDFTMTPATATIVTGRVDTATVPEGQMSAVRLFLARPLDPFVAESRVHRILATVAPDPDGRFTFHMVPPGDFVIEAAVGGEPPSIHWARQAVSVGSGNENPVTITLQPGINVAGRTRIVSTSRNVNVMPTMKLAVDFEPLFEVPGIRPFFASTTETGDFQTGAVLVPGRYRVSVGGIPPGWRLRAVTSGDIDVSDEGLDLSSGDTPPDLTIELTDQLTLITGTVRGIGPLADAASTVLLFPQGSQRLAARRYHSSRTTNDGTFTFRNVPAGAYLIVAVDEADAGGWQAPDRLQLLAARATHVQLREGEAKVLELRRAGVR